MAGAAPAYPPLAAVQPHAAEGPRPADRVGAAFLLLFLLGLYTGVDLRKGGSVLVPYVLCAATLPYFAACWGRRLPRRQVAALVALFSISGLGILLAPQAGVYLVERSKGLVHLVYSVSLSYLVFVYLSRRWPAPRLSRLFGWITVGIVVGTALEVYAGLRPVSDAVRTALFDPGFLYFEDERDLIYFGQIRPKLFTEEPSYVALFFLLSAFVWFSLSRSLHRRRLYILAVGLALFLIRSPIVLLAVPLAVLAEVFLRRAPGAGGRRRLGAAGWTRLAVFSLAGLVVLGVALRTVLGHRVELLASGRDLSTLTRTVVPALLSFHVVTTHPLAGVGLTGKEFLGIELENVYGGLGFMVSDTNRIVSAPFLFAIYYGLGAGLLMALAFHRLMVACGVTHKLFALVSIGILTAGMGAFVGMRTWFFVFTVFLVSALSSPLPGKQPRQAPRGASHAA